MKQKDEEFFEILKERDNLRMKDEMLADYLEKNNIKVESEQVVGNSVSLIDEYKNKIKILN